jgi:hypothetical protein
MRTPGSARRARLIVVVAVAATLHACGGSGSTSAAPTPSAAASGPVSSASARASDVPASLPVSPVPSPTVGPAAVKIVSDATGVISIAVPADWSVASIRWYHGDVDRGPALVASPDPTAFAAAFDGRTGSRARWGMDGVFVGVSRSLADERNLGDTYVSAITALAKWHGGDEETERGWNDVCLRAGASTYDADDGGANGFVTTWRDCGGIGTLLLDLGATGREGGYVAQALVVQTDGDLARDRASTILASLIVDPTALGG